MPRRFYLRPAPPPPETPATIRHAYPRWFVPSLIAVGAILGLVAYLLITCNPQEGRRLADNESSSPAPGSDRVDMAESGASRDAASPTGVPAAAHQRSFEGLRIQVLNGCGVKGLARVMTTGLRSFGFDVRESKNASHFDYKSSTLIDRTGDVALARRIADSLHIDPRNVSSERSSNLVDIDLTLIVGADYRKLNLHRAPTAQE